MMNNKGMAGMMKQMQVMQQKLDKIQQELENKIISAESGGGMVKASVNGKQRLLSIKVDPSLLTDVEMMEDLIVAAINKAMEESTQLNQEETKKAYSGMMPNIPGMDKFF